MKKTLKKIGIVIGSLALIPLIAVASKTLNNVQRIQAETPQELLAQYELRLQAKREQREDLNLLKRQAELSLDKYDKQIQLSDIEALEIMCELYKVKLDLGLQIQESTTEICDPNQTVDLT